MGHQVDDTGNTSRTADKDNFVNTRCVDLDLGIPFDGIKGALEKVLTKFLKAGTGKRGIEIIKRVDFDRGLGG